MGFFDIFKKKEARPTKVQEQIQEKPYEISYSKTERGDLQVDFFDKTYEEGRDYDVTRLVVGHDLKLAEAVVQNCAVSWYGTGDEIHINPQYRNESIRANEYRGVLIQIAPIRLQQDSDYCRMVMKGLLNRDRVTKYLSEGLSENPRVKCGKYVGGIRIENGMYKKFFDVEAGMASHNSKLMIERRAKLRNDERRKIESKIAKKEAEIAELRKMSGEAPNDGDR